MAGITNPGFRRLCREQGAGFYVCEMITSRGLVERNPLTFRMIAFDADEQPRSLQLYGVDPATVGAAVRWSSKRWPTTSTSTSVARYPRSRAAAAGRRCRTSGGCSSGLCAPRSTTPGECPSPSRCGSGSTTSAHLPRGRRGRAADAGVAAVALHARTAAQRYSGTADWSDIARLATRCPRASRARQRRHLQRGDALAMVATTGCDGVVVGRGCLAGRGCSASWRLPSPVGRSPAPTPRTGHGAAAARRAALRPHGPGQGHPRHAQAHRLVPQGLCGGIGDPSPARAGREPGRAGRAARHTRCRPAVPGRGRRPPGTAGLAGSGRAARGWLDDPDDPPCRSGRSSSTRAGDGMGEPLRVSERMGAPRTQAVRCCRQPATRGGREMDSSTRTR